MDCKERWGQAQETEAGFWNGFARSEPTLLDTLSANAQKALQLRQMLRAQPQTCLEIGVGPLGIGVIGFLPEIPYRVGIDSLQSVQPDGVGRLREYVGALRAPVHYIVAQGEAVPIRTGSMQLVVCCNVLDHVENPDAILAEVRRVLKPGGHLFLDVHTFSVLGLAKWHGWTKRRHRDEILVKAHPYRFFETALYPKFKAHGFQILERRGHSLLSLCIGHARATVFLATTRDGPPRPA